MAHCVRQLWQFLSINALLQNTFNNKNLRRFIAAHLHRFHKGIMTSEQPLGQFVGDHTGGSLTVLFGLIQELPGDNFGLGEFRIIGIGADELTIHFATAMHDIQPLIQNGQHAFHPRHGFFYARCVRILESIDRHPPAEKTLPIPLHLSIHGWGPDASNDDIFCAQRLDRFLCVVTGPFTNSDQRNDRPYPNDHAQHRETAAQLVQ